MSGYLVRHARTRRHAHAWGSDSIKFEAHLMRLELLRLRVHAVLPDGEDPLDVSVVRLQLSVLSVPRIVEAIDEVTVGARGYLACVEFEVVALIGIVLLAGVAVAIAAQGRERRGTINRR